MVKLTISKRARKCRKCGFSTIKVRKIRQGSDTFYIPIKKLMCGVCGYTYFGELKENQKREIKISNKKYKKALEQYRIYQSTGDFPEWFWDEFLCK